MVIEAAQGHVRDVPLLFAGWCAVVAFGIARIARIARQAVHAGRVDPLTHLPNRGELIELVDSVLRRRADVALVHLDLDRFRRVNEAVGELAGDQLLVQVAERLRAVVRPTDLVARLGSDEFVVLCEDVSDEAAARAVGDRLTAGLVEPFWVDSSPHFLSASIGVATGNGSSDDLLRRADVAMYRAKTNGKGDLMLYDSSMSS